MDNSTLKWFYKNLKLYVISDLISIYYIRPIKKNYKC